MRLRFLLLALTLLIPSLPGQSVVRRHNFSKVQERQMWVYVLDSGRGMPMRFLWVGVLVDQLARMNPETDQMRPGEASMMREELLRATEGAPIQAVIAGESISVRDLRPFWALAVALTQYSMAFSEPEYSRIKLRSLQNIAAARTTCDEILDLYGDSKSGENSRVVGYASLLRALCAPSNKQRYDELTVVAATLQNQDPHIAYRALLTQGRDAFNAGANAQALQALKRIQERIPEYTTWYGYRSLELDLETKTFESTTAPVITKEREQQWLVFLLEELHDRYHKEWKTEEVSDYFVAMLLEICMHEESAVSAAATTFINASMTETGARTFETTIRMLTVFLPVDLLIDYDDQQTLTESNGLLKFIREYTPVHIGNRPVNRFGSGYDEMKKRFGLRDLTPFVKQRLNPFVRRDKWDAFEASRHLSSVLANGPASIVLHKLHPVKNDTIHSGTWIEEPSTPLGKDSASIKSDPPQASLSRSN